MSGWWRRKPKDDAPSRAGAAETKANDGHEAGWLPTIGSRAAEAVRTALEHMEADERAMCSEGLWRESGSSTRIAALHAHLMGPPARRPRPPRHRASARRRAPRAGRGRARGGARHRGGRRARHHGRHQGRPAVAPAPEHLHAARRDRRRRARPARVRRSPPRAATAGVRRRGTAPAGAPSNAEAQRAAVRALVAELPPINRQLLGRVAAHFAKVVKRSRLNRMSWAAVAVAVAPTLLRGGEGGPASASPDALAKLAADAKADAVATERLLRSVAPAPAAKARSSRPRPPAKERSVRVSWTGAPWGDAAARESDLRAALATFGSVQKLGFNGDDGVVLFRDVDAARSAAAAGRAGGWRVDRVGARRADAAPAPAPRHPAAASLSDLHIDIDLDEAHLHPDPLNHTTYF